MSDDNMFMSLLTIFAFIITCVVIGLLFHYGYLTLDRNECKISESLSCKLTEKEGKLQLTLINPIFDEIKSVKIEISSCLLRTDLLGLNDKMLWNLNCTIPDNELIPTRIFYTVTDFNKEFTEQGHVLLKSKNAVGFSFYSKVSNVDKNNYTWFGLGVLVMLAILQSFFLYNRLTKNKKRIANSKTKAELRELEIK